MPEIEDVGETWEEAIKTAWDSLIPGETAGFHRDYPQSSLFPHTNRMNCWCRVVVVMKGDQSFTDAGFAEFTGHLKRAVTVPLN